MSIFRSHKRVQLQKKNTPFIFICRSHEYSRIAYPIYSMIHPRSIQTHHFTCTSRMSTTDHQSFAKKELLLAHHERLFDRGKVLPPSRPSLMTQNSVLSSRVKLEELLKKRFFFAPSFSIYGGVAGLYDYGPPGCALQANMLALWRQRNMMR